MMITLQDVAQSAGVSKSVASRALSGDTRARINAETVQRVRGAAQRLNYVPNHRARALRFSRSGALALIVPAVNNAVFAELFAGVQETASKASMIVLLGELNRSELAQEMLAQIVQQGRVDGVVLQRPEDFDDGMLRRTLDVSQPVVLFNSTLSRRTGSVILQDALATHVATEHLLNLGHVRIGYIGGSPLHDAAKRRRFGYLQAMHAAGHRVDRDWIVPAGWEAPAGAFALTQLLNARRPPTGIVVASINAGFGAASAAMRHGMRLPADLSLVAIQDTWLAEVFNPPLTVVRMPMKKAGEVATKMLLDSLEGKPLKDLIVSDQPPELVFRSSTAPPASP